MKKIAHFKATACNDLCIFANFEVTDLKLLGASRRLSVKYLQTSQNIFCGDFVCGERRPREIKAVLFLRYEWLSDDKI